MLSTICRVFAVPRKRTRHTSTGTHPTLLACTQGPALVRNARRTRPSRTHRKDEHSQRYPISLTVDPAALVYVGQLSLNTPHADGYIRTCTTDWLAGWLDCWPNPNPTKRNEAKKKYGCSFSLLLSEMETRHTYNNRYKEGRNGQWSLLHS